MYPCQLDQSEVTNQSSNKDLYKLKTKSKFVLVPKIVKMTL